MRGCLVLAAALLLPSSSAAVDTYPRQPGVDAIHYRFTVTISDALDRIEGEAVATLRLIGVVEQIELDLVSADTGRGMTVSRVTSGGRAMAFVHARDRLRLPVPPDARPGHDVSYSIHYGGAPAASLVPRPTMHGGPSAFSDNWPDQVRHWLPMIDHPYDKATGELIVTAPAQFQVISNGVLVEEVDLPDGRRRTHWKQSVPIASWLYALGIARFDVHHAGMYSGVPLQTWVFPPDRQQGRELFEETSRRALAFFSDRVGPYPYEKLANVQAVGLAGGMENATAIFYGEKSVASGRAPVVHEIAHQWFGNSITEHDWDDVWLSEGFASYFTHLYTEHFEGRDALVAALRSSRTTVLETERKLPDTPVVHRNLADMTRVLNPLVYQKGAWILHMLRAEIGTADFWSGIRSYYQRFRDGNASTADFRHVMEEASGKELKGFFEQWLTRSGVPRVEGSWRYDAATKAVRLTLSQTHATPPYRLTVEVGLLDAEGTTLRSEQVTFDSASHSVTIPLEAVPASAVLDPGTWLLAEFGPFVSSDGPQ